MPSRKRIEGRDPGERGAEPEMISGNPGKTIPGIRNDPGREQRRAPPPPPFVVVQRAQQQQQQCTRPGTTSLLFSCNCHPRAARTYNGLYTTGLYNSNNNNNKTPITHEQKPAAVTRERARKKRRISSATDSPPSKSALSRYFRRFLPIGLALQRRIP